MINIEQTLKKGVEYHTAGNLKQAEQAYRDVLAIAPENPDATHFLGVLAFNVNRNDIARELITKAIHLTPDNPACYLNLGNVCQQENDLAQAIKWYEKSKHLNPANPKIYSNIGVALSKLGKLEESVIHLKEALRLDPDFAEAHNNLSETYKLMGQYDNALKSSKKAIALNPNFVAARWNQSILLLLQGDLKTGFKEYEWRWQRPKSPIRLFDTGVAWQGQPLEGKTIFVYEEQGLGDTLQFIRYLPFVQKIGGRVIFEVVPQLLRLVQSFKGFDRLYVGIPNIDTRSVDRFDYHVPLLSLPGILNTTLDCVPKNIPYLYADPCLSKIWQSRMGNNLSACKIGIVWAGHPEHANDMNRSVLLSRFKQLLDIPDVGLYSLQKEKFDQWTDISPEKIFLRDFGDEITDFSDTAAIMDNLDLVISIDTSVVHLAGAMGKKVWALLPFSPDWRWMTDRDDSPWYPSMRLFRQPKPGDWESVFRAVKKKLKNMLTNRGCN
ncbi:MAG: tetratricopeptide repeat-containing glycosyltransferase family protein [Pseudomonadota bacterium]